MIISSVKNTETKRKLIDMIVETAVMKDKSKRSKKLMRKRAQIYPKAKRVEDRRLTQAKKRINQRVFLKIEVVHILQTLSGKLGNQQRKIRMKRLSTDLIIIRRAIILWPKTNMVMQKFNNSSLLTRG